MDLHSGGEYAIFNLVLTVETMDTKERKVVIKSRKVKTLILIPLFYFFLAFLVQERSFGCHATGTYIVSLAFGAVIVLTLVRGYHSGFLKKANKVEKNFFIWNFQYEQLPEETRRMNWTAPASVGLILGLEVCHHVICFLS